MDYQKERITEFQDPTTYTQYDEYLRSGMDETEAIARINLETREHSRTPMQWSDAPYAGFSGSEPWFAVNPNYRQINYASQKNDPDSLYAYYKKMIALRKSEAFQELFIYGSITPMYASESGIIGYERSLGSRSVVIVINTRSEAAVLSLPGKIKRVLLSNYSNVTLPDDALRLERFQVLVLERGYCSLAHQSGEKHAPN